MGALRHLSQQFTSLSVSLCFHLEVLRECVSGIWRPTPPSATHAHTHKHTIALVFCTVYQWGAKETALALSNFTANRYLHHASSSDSKHVCQTDAKCI